MRNLASIYFYGDAGKPNLDKAIELLVRSYKKSKWINFLCLVVFKKYESLDSSKIRKKIEEIDMNLGKSLSEEIIRLIKIFKLNNPSVYETSYKKFKDINYVYYADTIEKQQVKKKIEKIDKRPTINSLFYEGFGMQI